MPKNTPVLSWTQIRNYAERWSWTDVRTGVRVTGLNVPEKAKDKAQVPYFLRVVTLKGELMEGEVITLKVWPEKHRRLIRFTQSGEIRNIADYLIISIDGIRFVTH